jgi:hypothetical protein
MAELRYCSTSSYDKDVYSQILFYECIGKGTINRHLISDLGVCVCRQDNLTKNVRMHSFREMHNLGTRKSSYVTAESLFYARVRVYV